MKKAVYLVSCVSKKLLNEAQAQDLYVSPWFIKAKAYVRALNVEWYILSAKYRLVHPLDIISPYDLTMADLSKDEKAEWAEEVAQVLNGWDVSLMILAGRGYRDVLVPKLRHEVYVPMEGMGIGRQLEWLGCRDVYFINGS